MTTATKTDPFQQFCASLPWEIPILWQGKSGVHQLDGDRRVVIELSTWGHGDEYPGFWVEIISKTNGLVVKKYFKFDEYLFLADISESSASHPNVHTVKSFHVWREGRWYIREPRDPSPFTHAVGAWIEQWR